MLHIVLVTVLIYSSITFIISLITNNEEADRVLAYGFVGMLAMVLFIPIRIYLRNGFYVCEFKKEGGEPIYIYTRGGEKPYSKLKVKYSQDEYNCISRKIYFKKYFKGKYLGK